MILSFLSAAVEVAGYVMTEAMTMAASKPIIRNGFISIRSTKK